MFEDIGWALIVLGSALAVLSVVSVIVWFRHVQKVMPDDPNNTVVEISFLLETPEDDYDKIQDDIERVVNANAEGKIKEDGYGCHVSVIPI